MRNLRLADSRFLPQRGSRAKLITGAQYVEYACPTFIKARASVAIFDPVVCQRLRLKEATVVMGKAKFVEPGVAPELFTCDRPCVASDHQLYSFWV